MTTNAMTVAEIATAKKSMKAAYKALDAAHSVAEGELRAALVPSLVQLDRALRDLCGGEWR